VISIIGIITVQIYFIQKTLSIKEKQINQSINIALRNVADIISSYNNSTLPYGNPVYQFSSDYFIVNVNDVIDAEILEHYLISEFKSRNIKLDFEYAIYDCHNDEMVYGDYITLTKKSIVRKQKKNLQKYDKYIYYFGIYFPGIRNYILSDMGIWYFFSAILLIVLVFFGYTLFVIFRQKQLAEIQKDFINNMTHEFKTPLTSISISAEVIGSAEITSEPERLINYSNIIKNQSIALQEQVEKVLQMAETDKRVFHLKKEEINLHELIDEIVRNSESKLIPNRGEISLKLDSQYSKIYADKFHLSNLILNIIDNSIKYTREEPQITIKTNYINKQIVLSFADKGSGIKKEYHKKVFKKFFRVPTGNIHDVKGFGLGLCYVKRVVLLHKWKIKLESEVGFGTVISIYIPVKL